LGSKRLILIKFVKNFDINTKFVVNRLLLITDVCSKNIKIDFKNRKEKMKK